jgi:hypothetical protein
MKSHNVLFQLLDFKLEIYNQDNSRTRVRIFLQLLNTVLSPAAPCPRYLIEAEVGEA